MKRSRDTYIFHSSSFHLRSIGLNHNSRLGDKALSANSSRRKSGRAVAGHSSCKAPR